MHSPNQRTVILSKFTKGHTQNNKKNDHEMAQSQIDPGPKVIKLEFILKLKIKRNDGLLVDTCPEAAHYCALF